MPHGSMKKNVESCITDINRHIILNAFNLADLGLYRGKMGIILYFYIYSRSQNEKIYENYAGELLENIFDEINIHLPFFFDDGLCGIGWGIEYLAQNGYITIDTNEILSDLDKFIMQVNPTRIVNNGFDKGLAGLVNYVSTRLTSHAKSASIPFDKEYLSRLYEFITQKHKQLCKTHRIFNEFITYFEEPYYKRAELDSLFFVTSPDITEINEENILNYPLGIKDGLSGTCLKKLILNE